MLWSGLVKKRDVLLEILRSQCIITHMDTNTCMPAACNNKIELESSGYSAIPSPPRLMRCTCSCGSADTHTHTRTHTHTHTQTPSTTILRSQSDTAKVINDINNRKTELTQHWLLLLMLLVVELFDWLQTERHWCQTSVQSASVKWLLVVAAKYTLSYHDSRWWQKSECHQWTQPVNIHRVRKKKSLQYFMCNFTKF